MSFISKQIWLCGNAAAIVILSVQVGIADEEASGDDATRWFRELFHTPAYNYICPLAEYNEDYRSAPAAQNVDAIAGELQNPQIKTTQLVEASNG